MRASTDEELQQWLDEQNVIAAIDARVQEALRKQVKLPTFEEMKFNLKRELYLKAINA